MNASQQRARGPLIAVHPYVLERRLRDVLTTVMLALIPAALALAVTIAFPHASLVVVLGIIAGLVGIVALMVCSRLELTVTLMLLFLLLIFDPVKMFTSSREATAPLEDIVIFAVSLGAVMRIVVRRERIRLPPFSGWVIAWVLIVLANAFNPKTQGFLAVIGGFSNGLQYVPFFFFGYTLMRSKRRFRQLFLILGVVATASGIVAAYQTELTPAQLASWGPGYKALIQPRSGGGGKGGSGRVYFSEGEARVRPPGLGDEAGASGAIGHIALPMCLALVALTRGRRRWVAVILALGSTLGVVVGLGRTSLIAAGLSVLAFAGLSLLSGRHFTRAMGAMLAVVVLAIPLGALAVSALRSGTFKRYESLNTSSETTEDKAGAWKQVPGLVAAEPLGFGLGNSGSFAGRVGANKNLIEGHGLTSESEYNVLVKELGAPGLILWPVLAVFASLVAARGMRRIRDGEMAIYLAGALAAFVPLPIDGTTGFLGGSLAGGGYYWFAIGVIAYWLVGRRDVLARALPRRGVDDAAVPA
jgi:hypothetical protein